MFMISEIGPYPKKPFKWENKEDYSKKIKKTR